ncbi:uncharacterized protein LOC119908885 [Micropterus salmoides]|uniref:uncharacterized protein LOC119908885 n=1 Tax=Micropterus salmoides TaxID=27706 RepID=UPI0018ECC59F|nr:uncharacterized protein LOC119908885 [Micropterus salmoides]
MAGIIHIVVRLLLLFSYVTGVNGKDGLIVAEQGYNIIFPCEEDLVCFHIWQLNTSKTSDYIAIVRNGQIQTAKSEDRDSKCTQQIKALTVEDVGRHHCQQKPDVISPHNTTSTPPELNLMPGKTVSLQCILLTYVKQGHCDTQLPQVSLTWVDESGTEIQEDSQHHIKYKSSCDITLTVNLQSPKNKKFRCQATVDEQVQTSVEMHVRDPALKGKGRGLIIELEPEKQAGNQSMISAVVGVVGCVALTALVAVFLVNRRRTSNQLPDESCDMTNTNNVMNEDDVIYADIILPVLPGSDSMRVHECESTEYACVRYN